MQTQEVMTYLTAAGLTLTIDGDQLLVSPSSRVTAAHRELIRSRRDDLIDHLRFDTSAEYGAALATGSLVVCRACRHFTARPGRQPNGWCELHGETWAAMPFDCPDYGGEWHSSTSASPEPVEPPEPDSLTRGRT